MILDKVKNLLRPDVDPGVKLTGVGVFIGKTFDWLETRIADLEKRQLEKGDKGDKGDPPTQEELLAVLNDTVSLQQKAEMEDLRKIMESSWKEW